MCWFFSVAAKRGRGGLQSLQKDSWFMVRTAFPLIPPAISSWWIHFQWKCANPLTVMKTIQYLSENMNLNKFDNPNESVCSLFKGKNIANPKPFRLQMFWPSPPLTAPSWPNPNWPFFWYNDDAVIQRLYVWNWWQVLCHKLCSCSVLGCKLNLIYNDDDKDDDVMMLSHCLALLMQIVDYWHRHRRWKIWKTKGDTLFLSPLPFLLFLSLSFRLGDCVIHNVYHFAV